MNYASTFFFLSLETRSMTKSYEIKIHSFWAQLLPYHFGRVGEKKPFGTLLIFEGI